MPQPKAQSHAPTATLTSTPHLRCLFFVLVLLVVVSLLALSSWMGGTPHFQAFQQLATRSIGLNVKAEKKSNHDSREKTARAETFVIPGIIHQSWKNRHRIPTRFHPWMKSWVDFHPTWTYVFWTDEDNLQLFEQLYPQYLYVAKAVKKVSLADMARYALLYQVGGLYVDVDFECLQSFEDLHRTNSLFLSSEPLAHTVLLEKSTSAALCNALMASAPRHPFWLLLLDNIKDKFDRNRLMSDAVELTGPRMVKQIYLQSTYNSEGPNFVVFPSEYFYPEVAYWNIDPMEKACRQRHDEAAKEACEWLQKFPKGEFTNKTHATHHWQCTWCRDTQINDFGSLQDIFETNVMRPNITSTGVKFV